MTRASEAVGPSPTGAVREVSLAVRRYLTKHRPLGLVVGVSGGADSTALAVAAIDQASRMRIPLRTVTVDHGIRAESSGEAAAVRELMILMGAQQAEIATGSIPASGGPEGSARELRYRALECAASTMADSCGPRGVDVLLGHTLDDQAETTLLRLARGASAGSLAGMRERREAASDPRVRIGRPLLGVRRADTVEFCASLGLAVVDDPSNSVDGPWRDAGGRPLRRAAVREWALPSLSRALDQDVAPALARAAIQARDDDEALQEWSQRLVVEADTGDGWAVGVLGAAPTAVRTRALRRILLQSGTSAAELTARHIDMADNLVSEWRGQGAVSLPGGVELFRVGAVLRSR